MIDNVVIGNDFPAVTFCENDRVDINPSIGGTATDLSYLWATQDSLGTYYTFSTDSMLHFDALQLSDERQYTLVVTDRCGASTVGNEFVLNINPAPLTTLTGLNATYCTYNTSDVTVGFSPAGGAGSHDITYSWYDANTKCFASITCALLAQNKKATKTFVLIASYQCGS